MNEPTEPNGESNNQEHELVNVSIPTAKKAQKRKFIKTKFADEDDTVLEAQRMEKERLERQKKKNNEADHIKQLEELYAASSSTSKLPELTLKNEDFGDNDFWDQAGDGDFECGLEDSLEQQPCTSKGRKSDQNKNVEVIDVSSAFIPQDITPLPSDIPMPKSEDLSKLLNLVQNAKRPVLLIGSQATLPPISPHDLVAAVKKLGIPVFLGGMSRGLLGAESDIQMRHVRRDALKDADLTILAGTVCDFRLSYGRNLSKKSKIVAINRNSSQLTKNEKAFWNADVSVQADVASTLVQVASMLGSDYKRPTEWTKDLKSRDQQKEKDNEKKMEDKFANGFLNPLNFLKTFNTTLPDDAILVADGGDFVGSAAYIVKPRGPLQWLDPGAFGTLGVGGGFALGAKIVHPEKPVYILWGDGSCGYSLMEFDTFARHKLPVIAVVGNDACWTQIAREQIPMFQSSVAVDLARTRYDNVAEALGANGSVINAENVDSTVDTLGGALKESRSQNGRSSLINVMIGKTNFRDGSISV